MNRILIPTDFTEESLQLIEFAMLNFTSDKLDIVLIHGYRPPDLNMRYYSPNRILSKLCSTKFAKGVRNISNDHRDRINRIQIQVYTGVNSIAFSDFLQSHRINAAVLPNVPFVFPRGGRSFDLTKLISRHLSNIVEVPLSRSRDQVIEPRFSLLGLWYF